MIRYLIWLSNGEEGPRREMIDVIRWAEYHRMVFCRPELMPRYRWNCDRPNGAREGGWMPIGEREFSKYTVERCDGESLTEREIEILEERGRHPLKSVLEEIGLQ